MKSIELVAERLAALMPNISIGMAHGQRHENELEKVMLDFYHHVSISFSVPPLLNRGSMFLMPIR
ncbi:hypothetical protein [Ignatzschineria indica]|uniref:hypothetical protein n=1 Tax=Ignatzschineria indica TaxID=472583 RepID=UPI0036326B76